MADELTDQQEQFCQEYLKDLNGTQAAIRAGYSAKSSRAISSTLLTKHNIQARLKVLIGDRSQRCQISADEVLLAIKKLAFFNLSDLFDENGDLKPMSEIPEEARGAINGVEVFVECSDEENEDGETVTKITGRTKKVKLSERIKALELLGRHLKLFTDKFEHDTNPLAAKTMAELLARRNELRKRNK